jgi:hypothetical protein
MLADCFRLQCNAKLQISCLRRLAGNVCKTGQIRTGMLGACSAARCPKILPNTPRPLLSSCAVAPSINYESTARVVHVPVYVLLLMPVKMQELHRQAPVQHLLQLHAVECRAKVLRSVHGGSLASVTVYRTFSQLLSKSACRAAVQQMRQAGQMHSTRLKSCTSSSAFQAMCGVHRYLSARCWHQRRATCIGKQGSCSRAPAQRRNDRRPGRHPPRQATVTPLPEVSAVPRCRRLLRNFTMADIARDLLTWSLKEQSRRVQSTLETTQMELHTLTCPCKQSCTPAAC